MLRLGRASKVSDEDMRDMDAVTVHAFWRLLGRQLERDTATQVYTKRPCW
jgi:hypothetical protein